MDEAKKTLNEIKLGIIAMAIVQSIIGVILIDNPVNFILGELLGTIGAMIFMNNLYSTLDIALSLDEDNAVKYTRKKAVVRMILLVAVIFISFVLMEYVSVLGTFLGLMNIKFGVYLVPLARKYKKDEQE